MTTVRFFHNGTAGVGGMTGAPSLSGTPGSMIAVLDACLVDGWGTGTVDSVVISGGIATVTRATGHPFDVDCVAEIAGCTGATATLNAPQKVLSVTGTTWTFATALANQAATGTITHKVASLGWAKAFSGTTLAAYRPADVAATRMFLRVDDTAAQSARVVGYTSMSGIGAGLTGPFPTDAQVSGGGYWSKSQSADATARDWVLVGDSRGFVIWARHAPNSGNYIVGFGDYQSTKPADAFACFLNCGNFPFQSTGAGQTLSRTGANVGIFTARGVSGIGQSVNLVATALSPTAGGDNMLSGGGGMAFPNPAANELYVSQILLSEQAPLICYRGVVPGVRFCPMSVGGGVFGFRERLTGVTGMSGRTLRAVPANEQGGPFFIDVTGPWAR